MLPHLTGRSVGTDGVILWCEKFAEICRSLLSAFGNWKKRNGLERGINKIVATKMFENRKDGKMEFGLIL